MITLEDYFGRISFVQWGSPPPDVSANAEVLLKRVNGMLARVRTVYPEMEAAKNPVVNSGWRPPAYNATIPNAAPKSRHMTGEAIDLSDPEGELDDFLTNNFGLLMEAELWMEHPLSTKGWCHLQSVPPKSGNRIFYP